MKRESRKNRQVFTIIDVLAPASRCPLGEIAAAQNFLKVFGVQGRVPKNIFGESPFFANSVEARTKFFSDAAFAKDSDILWCLRGGYGSMQLVDQLLKLKKKPKKKILVGLSDITALANFVTQRWGWKAIHGPMLGRVGSGRASVIETDEVLAMLTSLSSTEFGSAKESASKKIIKKQNELPFFHHGNLRPLNSAARKLKKSIRAEFVGGNLCVLQAGIATPWSLKAKNKILFLEEIGERGYRIHRMLNHLQQSQSLKGVRAVIWGDVLPGLEADGKNRCWEAIEDFFAHSKIPVFTGIHSGHGEIQRPLLLNSKVELAVTGSGATLNFLGMK